MEGKNHKKSVHDVTRGLIWLISIILETDSNAIVSRVSRPRMDVVDIPFSEQTLLQAYQTAKDKFASQLLR
jgi:hypothetical protein